MQGYREEVATLRHDLHRRQSDVDRFSGERADLDRKKNELDAEILRANSRLREVENSSARYEKEIDRYNAELDRLREQLTLKDNDLRNTINSLQEIQKSGSEEKNGMRTELRSVLNSLFFFIILKEVKLEVETLVQFTLCLIIAVT